MSLRFPLLYAALSLGLIVVVSPVSGALAADEVGRPRQQREHQKPD